MNDPSRTDDGLTESYGSFIEDLAKVVVANAPSGWTAIELRARNIDQDVLDVSTRVTVQGQESRVRTPGEVNGILFDWLEHLAHNSEPIWESVRLSVKSDLTFNVDLKYPE